MMKICCVCQRQQRNNQWRSRPRIPEKPVTHGYCPDCFTKAMVDLEKVAITRSGRHQRPGLPPSGGCLQ